MDFTEAHIAILRELEPGWEEIWEEVCLELLGPDGESGRLVSAVSSLRILRSAFERDDFVSIKLVDFWRRLQRKTLLKSYDASQGSLLDFLCSRRLLLEDARRYRSRIMQGGLSGAGARKQKTVTLSSKESENDADHSGIWGNHPDTRLSEKIGEIAEKMQQALEALVVDISDETSQPECQAGLQLYPRLDRSNRRMRDLITRVTEMVSGALSIAMKDSEEKIQSEHRQASQEIRDKMEALAEKRIELSNAPQAMARSETRWTKLFIRSIMEPLEAKRVALLFGISESNAYQALTRYRRILPELLPQLEPLYLEIQALRE